MKKYVLNIDRLYSGQTAKALVLNQVDEDFPVLLPSIPRGTRNWNAWIQKFKEIHSDFNPGTVNSLDELNEKVIDFNLDLQVKFKEKGYKELYMMDDTPYMKPNEDTNMESEKTYLHCLNGKALVKDDDWKLVNSSQMNVLFPYKKFSSKSLYASQLTVESAVDVDDILERSRGITLHGNVSYEKCLQSTATVGNNLYVLSSTVELADQAIYGNNFTIVNSYGNKPFPFPHTMTLFQPSQKEYVRSTIQEFRDWYVKHNRKTVVSLDETYGGNITYVKCLGTGSYELELGTYSPTSIVVFPSSNPESKKVDIPLTSDQFRKIRSGEDIDNFYEDGSYVIDNGVNDLKNELAEVGIMFNLYDTFISGDERILDVAVPKDKDFNKLLLKFEWESILDSGLLGYFDAHVFVNGVEVGQGECEYEITDAIVEDHSVKISVKIFYDVDFGLRNTTHVYRQMLKNSGIVIKNLRIENGATSEQQLLTFGSYINESGISEEEHDRRYEQFWEVSQYKKDVTYQTVLESSLKNATSAGIQYLNNYSSGDIYGDLFFTKSVLDPRYDMNMSVDPEDESQLKAIGREYIGLCECSNQLSLLYKPTTITISEMANGGVQTKRNPDQENGLNYQMVEVVKNINRFESSIKHKSNVFSVVVENSNLAPDNSESRDETLERYKEQLRNSVTQFVRNTCEGIVPVHTQLFDVQFT